MDLKSGLGTLLIVAGCQALPPPPTCASTPEPQAPGPTTGAVSCAEPPCPVLSRLALGTWAGCALTTDGGVLCWLEDDSPEVFGVMGNGEVNRPDGGVVRANLADAVDLDLSRSGARDNIDSHACAVTGDGRVWCWGGNSGAQVGPPEELSSTVRSPVPVDGVSGARTVRVGPEQSCAIDANGALSCWGEWCTSGGSGMLFSERFSPVGEAVKGKVVQVALGAQHRCALRADGSVWCRGVGVGGHLGDGSRTPCATQWVAAAGLSQGVVELSAGSAHTCARLCDGTVRCWGQTSTMAKAIDQSSSVGLGPLPVTMPALEGATGLTSGADTTCGLFGDGVVRCIQVSRDTSTPHADSFDLPMSGVVEARIGLDRACTRNGEGVVQCMTLPAGVPAEVRF